jgi:hypothetical protein
MKKITLFLAVFAASCGALFASDTTVADTVYYASNGRPASGALVIRPSSAFTSTDGREIAQVASTVPIVNGTF